MVLRMSGKIDLKILTVEDLCIVCRGVGGCFNKLGLRIRGILLSFSFIL